MDLYSLGGDCFRISEDLLENMIEPKAARVSPSDSSIAGDFNISLSCVRNFVRSQLKLVSEPEAHDRKRFENSTMTLIHYCGRICDGLRLSDIVPSEDGFPFCLYFCLDEQLPQIYAVIRIYCAIRASDGAIITWLNPIAGSRRHLRDETPVYPSVSSLKPLVTHLDSSIGSVHKTVDTICFVTKKTRKIYCFGQSHCPDSIKADIDGDIASIYSTHNNFLVVRKSDGKIFFWGRAIYHRLDAGQYLESQNLHGNIRSVFPSNDELILVRNTDGALVPLRFDRQVKLSTGPELVRKIPTTVQSLLQNDLETIYCT